MTEEKHDDAEHLLAKKKDFLSAFFRKGADFVQELLSENEKMRFRVVQLEEELASVVRSIPTPGTLRELVEKIHVLETERAQLLQRFSTVQRENQNYQSRYEEIERENNTLVNLYVASQELRSTLDLKNVLRITVEILLNFIGATRFAVLLADEDAHAFRALVAQGVSREWSPRTSAGKAAITEPRFGPLPETGSNATEDPIVSAPIRLHDKTLGLLAIWDFLPHKQELAEVDRELVRVLADHLANSLEAAELGARASGAQGLEFKTVQALLEGG